MKRQIGLIGLAVSTVVAIAVDIFALYRLHELEIPQNVDNDTGFYVSSAVSDLVQQNPMDNVEDLLSNLILKKECVDNCRTDTKIDLINISLTDNALENYSRSVFEKIAHKEIIDEFILNADTSGDVGNADNASGYYSNLSEDEVLKVLNELRFVFPSGKYFNHGGVTDSPCIGHSAGIYSHCNSYIGKASYTYRSVAVDKAWQCLAYACLFSDNIFGKDCNVTIFDDYSLLHVGDLIRYGSKSHSAVVLSVSDDGITVTECNRDNIDCMIEWDRFISFDELKREDVFYLTRYEIDE